jgi:hypothetical protein
MSPDMRQVTPKLRYKFTEAASLYMTSDTKLKPYRLGREHNISNNDAPQYVGRIHQFATRSGLVRDAGVGVAVLAFTAFSNPMTACNLMPSTPDAQTVCAQGARRTNCSQHGRRDRKYATLQRHPSGPTPAS